MYYITLTYVESDMIYAALTLTQPDAWACDIISTLGKNIIRVTPWQLAQILYLLNIYITTPTQDWLKLEEHKKARINFLEKVRYLMHSVPPSPNL